MSSGRETFLYEYSPGERIIRREGMTVVTRLRVMTDEGDAG